MSKDIRTGDPGFPEPKYSRRDASDDQVPTEAGNIQDDSDASLADTAVVTDESQDFDNRDPSASDTPPFGDDADLPPRYDQQKERSREVKGNRGPDELKGFGQGA